MTQKSLLHVPQNWPLCWNGGNNVRGACPSCGEFHLYIDRPDEGSPTIECKGCGLSGVAAVQRKFNALTKTKPTPQIEEAATS
ncbi:hypothetical protein [Roseomonas fluvialis]|uniref:Uncharacterized protein n=1 Tax=Roseomonas fluvialis TaxID=1750527 RepID=A0ABN6P1W4_9PROT|nr:hypothetical protein [Roseomonas fluvialis]BDG71978.1 hypothetical protein Rmf_19070 [Roseomonas fluvialis]